MPCLTSANGKWIHCPKSTRRAWKLNIEGNVHINGGQKGKSALYEDPILDLVGRARAGVAAGGHVRAEGGRGPEASFGTGTDADHLCVPRSLSVGLQAAAHRAGRCALPCAHRLASGREPDARV